MENNYNLSEEQINKILSNYKKKAEREKHYYHNVAKLDENFKIKNRQRAKAHYEKNKDKKKEKYDTNKDFLKSKSLYNYYKKNDRIDDFKKKHDDKFQILKNKGLVN